MSLIDRLTDRQLQDLVGQKNLEIALLRRRVKDLEEALARTRACCDSKSKRIAALCEDLSELKRGGAAGQESQA